MYHFIIMIIMIHVRLLSILKYQAQLQWEFYSFLGILGVFVPIDRLNVPDTDSLRLIFATSATD